MELNDSDITEAHAVAALLTQVPFTRGPHFKIYFFEARMVGESARNRVCISNEEVCSVWMHATMATLVRHRGCFDERGYSPRRVA